MLRWLPLIALVGCIEIDTKDSGTATTGLPVGAGTGGGTGGGPGAGTGAAGTGTGAGTGAGTGTGTGTGTTSTGATAMCARWNADRATLTEGSWTGSVSSCDPGTLSQDAIDSTLRSVNLYRWLAGLDPVTHDAGRNADAQACSLMMDANNDIEHYPPDTWDCHTAAGDSTAGSSNLATTPSVTAIDLYMTDYGNSNTLGHRRWIIGNWIGPLGIGGTPDYSCLYVGGANGTPGPDWTAFPSPGPFPIEAMTYSWFADVDEEGWSIQSDSISFSGAQVTVTRAGQSLAVTTSTLPSNYGSSHALSIIPQGWATTVGTYSVDVTGLSQPIQYDVEIVECSP